MKWYGKYEHSLNHLETFKQSASLWLFSFCYFQLIFFNHWPVHSDGGLFQVYLLSEGLHIFYEVFFVSQLLFLGSLIFYSVWHPKLVRQPFPNIILSLLYFLFWELGERRVKFSNEFILLLFRKLAPKKWHQESSGCVHSILHKLFDHLIRTCGIKSGGVELFFKNSSHSHD